MSANVDRVRIEAALPASSAHIVLRDTEGRLLLQFRNGEARIDPLEWALWGGRIEPSDTSAKEAARRELGEELGWQIAPDDLDPVLVVEDPVGNTSTIFLCNRAIDWSEITVREGAGAAFFTRAELDLLALPAKLRELLRVLSTKLDVDTALSQSIRLRR